MKNLILILIAFLFFANGSQAISAFFPRQQLVGGYTKYRTVSQEEKDFFCHTYKQKPSLRPVKVATQVVAGTNYSFRCKDAKGNEYEVIIYQPLPGQGNPEVTSAKALKTESHNVVIVYYDPSVGPQYLDKVILKKKCTTIYKYKNINAYAVKLSGKSARKALEKAKGVLSVQDDKKMELQ